MEVNQLLFIKTIKKLVINNKNVILSLFLGQILSIFICGTAISSGFLTQINVNIPLSQSFLNYFLLALTYGIAFVYFKAANLWTIIKQRGWIYLLAAIIDVEANYAIVKAYQYTSVTSVQLLDCMTIPTVVACSLVVFAIRYRWSHYFGVILCLCGAVTMVLVDHFFNERLPTTTSANPLLGDALVIVGAILYGFSNVIQDLMVKKHGQLEFLAFIGVLCTLINGVQILIFEKVDLGLAIGHNFLLPTFWISIAGFVLSMFCLYSLMPYVMRISSSVVTNLSLLTADVYALIVGVFIFGNKFHWLYFVAYVLIMFGVGIFVSRNPVSVGEVLSLDECHMKCCLRRDATEPSIKLCVAPEGDIIE